MLGPILRTNYRRWLGCLQLGLNFAGLSLMAAVMFWAYRFGASVDSYDDVRAFALLNQVSTGAYILLLASLVVFLILLGDLVLRRRGGRPMPLA